MINSSTQLLGVIGDPISHSLSPEMQNFIIQKLGLNYCYNAFHVIPSDLEKAIESFQALNFKGINVTLPHKQGVIQFLDEVSEEARCLGAVNTIVFKNNRRFGFNTDVIGFLDSLGEFRHSLKTKTAIVIGAGGSARAVIYALIQDGIGEIKIFNRTTQKGEKLKSEMISITQFDKIYSIPPTMNDLTNEIQNASILINTTPIGMHPEVHASPVDDEFLFPKDILVYNLIYNPLETKFLQKARSAGAHIMNGLDMLIYQGIESLKIWTGVEIETEYLVPELREYLIKKISGQTRY
ncbi:shikimate dehydrogenase [candidate division KSB1 bacterium]|nr:shikimate dehydrogenase [candidate division KSB1 bacterium]